MSSPRPSFLIYRVGIIMPIVLLSSKAVIVFNKISDGKCFAYCKGLYYCNKAVLLSLRSI